MGQDQEAGGTSTAKAGREDRRADRAVVERDRARTFRAGRAVAASRRPPRPGWLVLVVLLAILAASIPVKARFWAPGSTVGRIALVSPIPRAAIPQHTYVNRFTPRGYERLVIGPSNQYTQVVTSVGLALTGTATEVGNSRVVFVEDGNGMCPGLPGVYVVSRGRDGLYLTPVSDECALRRTEFSSSLWKPYRERIPPGPG